MTGLPGNSLLIYYYCKYESFTFTVKDTDGKVYIVEGLEWAQTFCPHGVSGLIFVDLSCTPSSAFIVYGFLMMAILIGLR